MIQKTLNKKIWPRPIYRSIQLISHLQSLPNHLTLFAYPHKYIQYLINIVKSKNISIATYQLALSIANRFLRKNKSYTEPIQLTLLVSLFIASKSLETESISVLTLHNVSNHCFTNKDIYRMEQRILEAIGYDIFGQMISDIRIKTLLQTLDAILPKSALQILIPITEDIQMVLWYYFHTNKNGINKKYINCVPAAIIQIAFILTTQCSGRFPATTWMASIQNLRQDKLHGVIEELVKVVLGNQKFKQLNI